MFFKKEFAYLLFRCYNTVHKAYPLVFYGWSHFHYNTFRACLPFFIIFQICSFIEWTDSNSTGIFLTGFIRLKCVLFTVKLSKIRPGKYPVLPCCVTPYYWCKGKNKGNFYYAIASNVGHILVVLFLELSAQA